MSKVIHNPALANVEETGAHSASFVIEPLQAGYGNTLGNSLRRVLLSSVKGGAIVAFRVEGASHEFTTVDGIKEDVVDIMLNLKNVRVKVSSDEPVEVRIEKKGAGAITAADIKTTADVEVINPEQVIATVDDPKKTVVFDLVIDSGRGYQTIEDSSAKRLHSDMIALDAMFSPVLRVRYKVDSTRVGQETNLDKLQLNVETDGSISPQNALTEASKILIYHFMLFSDERITLETEAVKASIQYDEETLHTRQLLKSKLTDMDLSVRALNCLKAAEVETLGELVSYTKSDLMKFRNFGKKSLTELEELVHAKGLNFGFDVAKYKLDADK